MKRNNIEAFTIKSKLAPYSQYVRLLFSVITCSPGEGGENSVLSSSHLKNQTLKLNAAHLFSPNHDSHIWIRQARHFYLTQVVRDNWHFVMLFFFLFFKKEKKKSHISHQPIFTFFPLHCESIRNISSRIKSPKHFPLPRTLISEEKKTWILHVICLHVLGF